MEHVVIGLSAVVVGLVDGEAAVLTRAPQAGVAALPSGPFEPAGHRTFELALRAFVERQTGFELGYVEQLYTFGDQGRDAPLADFGPEMPTQGAKVVSVGYLALTPQATRRSDGAWTPWASFFPWEDWRQGRPEALATLERPLRAWAAAGDPDGVRLARVRTLFGLDGARWNEERVLDRFEILYEAGLVAEAGRDHAEISSVPPPRSGLPMISDHRRILATGLGRLRGKLKYRPVVFELMNATFTLSELQRTVEAIAGVALHKPNFRRMLERTGFVEGLGHRDATGGRPAELFRFRREALAGAPASGLGLPLLREG